MQEMMQWLWFSRSLVFSYYTLSKNRFSTCASILNLRISYLRINTALTLPLYLFWTFLSRQSCYLPKPVVFARAALCSENSRAAPCDFSRATNANSYHHRFIIWSVVLYDDLSFARFLISFHIFFGLHTIFT